MRKIVWLIFLVSIVPAHSAVFYVGPGMPYETPGEVSKIAQDGDTIEIEATDYTGDVAVWTQNNLVIRGIGGRPRLMAAGNAAEGKAIWVVKGDNTIIEDIEFSGAAVDDLNGAGIRLEGANLIVRRSFFHHNQNGILTGEHPSSEILIEFSEFANNGHGDGYSHNMYIGRVNKFTLQYSYVHHARVGHQVKSRARVNHIQFNRLMDEHDGTSSYLIDLPDPGQAFVIGNEMQQGRFTENSAMVNSVQELSMINNTLVNDRRNGVFVRTAGGEGTDLLQNNIFLGVGSIEAPGARLLNNLSIDEVGLVNRNEFDYRLASSSPAIDRGSSTDVVQLGDETRSEYRHSADVELQLTVGPIDIGAHEFDPKK